MHLRLRRYGRQECELQVMNAIICVGKSEQAFIVVVVGCHPHLYRRSLLPS